MDFNLVVLAGTLAAAPEIREFESGARLARYLVTTRVHEPRKRTDVLPVVLWDPPDDLVDQSPDPGRRVFVCGTLQRRFWEGQKGRRSRIELVAEVVKLRPIAGDDGQA
jgi:single-strand DNA-binding protein